MSYKTLSKGAAPSTPANGKGTEYLSTAGEVHLVDSSGLDANLMSKDRSNLLVNGGFWFQQRGAAATFSISGSGGRGYGAPDRWFKSAEFALSHSSTRVDTTGAPESGLTQGRFYNTFSNASNVQKVMIGQVLDGSDTALLRGRTVRWQCYLKANANTNYRMGIAYLTAAGTVDVIPTGTNLFVTAWGAASADPTLGANMSYQAPKAVTSNAHDNATANGNALDIVVTTAWQRFGGVFDIPSTAKNVMVLIWSNAQVANPSSVSMSQASLTDGPEIQDGFARSLQVELARVQRFYCKSFAIDTAPAQNAGLANSVRGTVSVIAAGAGQPIGIRYPVPMRTTPATFVFFNPSAANAFVRNTTAGSDATVTAAANAGEIGADASFTGNAAWTLAQALAVHYTADAEI